MQHITVVKLYHQYKLMSMVTIKMASKVKPSYAYNKTVLTKQNCGTKTSARNSSIKTIRSVGQNAMHVNNMTLQC